MSKTPFCNVCFDSGKPDTRHWVKDRNNKVCCPTLLALKCRLCGQCGHTVKYCTKTVANPKPSSKVVQIKPVTSKPMVFKPEPKNMFDLLDDDSDEEQEPDEPKKEEQQEPKKQEQAKPTIVKRWIDYDSDSDDEIPLSINPLPMPTLKRYGHSENSVESLMEVGM